MNHNVETPCKQSVKSNSIAVEESWNVMLIGITIGYKLSFKKYIINLCYTTYDNVYALTRIRKSNNNGQYINTEFDYTPPARIFGKIFSITLTTNYITRL